MLRRWRSAEAEADQIHYLRGDQGGPSGSGTFHQVGISLRAPLSAERMDGGSGQGRAQVNHGAPHMPYRQRAAPVPAFRM